jgi:nitroreductase
MNLLEAMHTRSSAAKLVEPAPQGEALANLLKAAVRASDHRRLRPWRFLVIEGAARGKLGRIFVDMALEADAALPVAEQEKIAAKALRAPLIIVVVARLTADAKVPEIEQLFSAAGAAQLLLLAAHAQGYGGIWRTGDVAYQAGVRQRLGLAETDRIVGFLYLGSVQGAKKPADIDYREYTEFWRG